MSRLVVSLPIPYCNFLRQSPSCDFVGWGCVSCCSSQVAERQTPRHLEIKNVCWHEYVLPFYWQELFKILWQCAWRDVQILNYRTRWFTHTLHYAILKCYTIVTPVRILTIFGCVPAKPLQHLLVRYTQHAWSESRVQKADYLTSKGLKPPRTKEILFCPIEGSVTSTNHATISIVFANWPMKHQATK